jgi:hypothetical protein
MQHLQGRWHYRHRATATATVTVSCHLHCHLYRHWRSVPSAALSLSRGARSIKERCINTKDMKSPSSYRKGASPGSTAKPAPPARA